MPHSGPSKSKVTDLEESQALLGVKLVKVDNEVAKKLAERKREESFSQVFGSDGGVSSYAVGPGDSIAVTIWETAPAILFREAQLDPNLGGNAGSAMSLPAQMIMEDGSITIPFAGRVKVVGRSLAKVEEDIVSRLAGKANEPQVMVRVANSENSRVSIIGDVAKSCNIPLTPKGEKLLDALAGAGGVTQPLNKVAIQVSRRGINARMPLDKIVDDPKQNIYLKPGDVVAAFFQPWTFSVLGATGRNQEVPFEASGISLAQAISRAGGLNDFRADPGGVFVFRFEDRKAVENPPLELDKNSKVPVVYQVDFSDPTAFFATQNFPMQDQDVMYVANMPSAELQKFLGMVGMVLSPTLNMARYQLDVGR